MPESVQVSTFFLVFLRALAFMASGPLLTIRGVPVLFKAGFSLALAVVIYPVVAGIPAFIPGDVWGYGLAVISETGIGLLLGVAVTMILNSFRIAGQMMDFQIGYSMSAMLDPISGAQHTLLSQYMYLLALLFFLLIDGHYALIIALVKSYELVPLSAASFSGGIAYVLLKIFAGTFTIALRVCAPVLAVLLISDLALGFLARTTPQINVFITGFPVKMMVGLTTLSFLIPLLGSVLRSVFDSIEKDLYLLMKALM